MSQQKAIKAIFLTELWERFSYYGISAILILYIIKTFHLAPSESYAIYGAYGALVYSTPIIGGMVVDRFLGTYKAIVLGAILISVGHFILLVPDHAHHGFFLGLSFVITGTGLFKPAIAAIIGELYQNNNTRERGFTLAYIGSNVGTIIAPIVCAFVGVHYGWNWAFGLAGFGMVFGLLLFVLAKAHFNRVSFAPIRAVKLKTTSLVLVLVALSVALIYSVFLALAHPELTGTIVEVVALISLVLAAFVIWRSKSERRNAIRLLVLTVFYVIFMILLQQTGGIMNVFTLQHVNRTVFGYTIPTGMFQSTEPLALVFFGLIWPRVPWLRAISKRLQGYARQFSFALMMMALGFLVVAIPSYFMHGLQNLLWVNLSYVVMAFGELSIGPIGLAMVSTMAPKKYVGFFMGLWVLASALANFSAAKVGMWANSGLAQGGVLSMQGYSHVYFVLALLGGGAALVLWGLRSLLEGDEELSSLQL